MTTLPDSIKKNPHSFSSKLRKLGLYRGLSAQHITILAMAQKSPLPVQERCREKGAAGKNIPSPSPLPGHSMGPCVAQKMLAMISDEKGKRYELTESGAQYLARLKQEGII